VPSNIAEGYGRATKGEYLEFPGNARGSNFEVETRLVLSQVLKFGSTQSRQEAAGLSEEAGNMLVAIIRSLRK
jgi:four helix bundle protein